MDRIQRILGVLQNPNTSRRFLGVLLKLEEMLQNWFPHVRPDLPPTDDASSAKKQKEVTQDNAVSSSTESHADPRLSQQGALPYKISSPCLERLLQAKDSIIITPRAVGDGGWSS
ncbi:Hypothetical protein SMAX5B_021162 [Scophthalmus maximus]|uniref:Circadian-associated transcriptional repressor-like n=1 Tax=Scophthalmus maximus TaxID=52904 RepID=A0A2U9BAT7_SCOMX|nr:Hypothetical protein SMAX5B_021162 [Scophthalmus maximus]